MEMFPIFLKLQQRPCLVVGAGTIAAPKIDSLLRAGAIVTVVAPEASAELAESAAQQHFRWIAREFETADLDGVFLVITATDRQPINHRVAEEARARNILCNSVDDPPDCDFFYPSVVRRNDLQIAISTAGKSPALAQRLRAEIDALLDEDAGTWLDSLGETRLHILSRFPASEERKQALHLLAQRETCEPQNCPVHTLLQQIAPLAQSSPSSHPPQ